MEDLTRSLTEIKPDQLVVIHCPDEQLRKQVHYYLERSFPALAKRSVVLPSRPHGGKILRFIECQDCDHPNVLLDTYHYGVLDNNEDQYMTGTCPKCSSTTTWECSDGYDDIRIELKANAIVVGNYLRRGYTRPRHADRSASATSEALDEAQLTVLMKDKRCVCDVISAPLIKQLSLKDLQDHIEMQIAKTGKKNSV
jgi:hypothetical protein